MNQTAQHPACHSRGHWASALSALVERLCAIAVAALVLAPLFVSLDALNGASAMARLPV